jgi:chemotaxis protein methyltransferase CheR
MLRHNLTSAASEFGYNNINGFIKWLLSTPLNKKQMEILAAHLTISETYFWREPQVFSALTDSILPELINSKKKKEKSISIWSAGCSTGEEPYSIAITLHKTIPNIKDWNITILASDINPKALFKAREGVYFSGSFRNSPSWLKSTYFRSLNNNEYVIIPEIKKMVTFSSFNLTQEDFLSSICNNHEMDIIFCRNVLMYFTQEWAGNISQNLFHSLAENGWLIVSSCELSSQLFPKLIPVNFPGAILYRKSDEKLIQSLDSKPYDSNGHLSVNTLPSLLSIDEREKQVFVFDPTPGALKKKNIKTIETPLPFGVTLQNSADQQPGENRSEAAINDKTLSIRLLANKGRLAEALSACDEAIKSYKLAPGLYFLRASVLQEMNKSHEAIKSLKQAIYLDPDYIMGHFTLGNLFIRQGNIKNAKRFFNNALELLKTFSNDEILAESEGLSAEYIREIIQTNLQTQKLT